MLDVMMQLGKLLWEPLKLALTNRDTDKKEREEFLGLAFEVNRHLSFILDTGESIYSKVAEMDEIVKNLGQMPDELITKAQFMDYGEAGPAEREIVSILTRFHSLYEEILKLSRLQLMNLRLFARSINESGYRFKEFSKLFPSQAYRLRALSNSKSSYIKELMRRIGGSQVFFKETSVDLEQIVDSADELGTWRPPDLFGRDTDDDYFAFISPETVVDISSFFDDSQYWKDDKVRVDLVKNSWPEIDFISIRARLDAIDGIVQEIDNHVKKSASVEQVMKFVKDERSDEKRLRREASGDRSWYY